MAWWSKLPVLVTILLCAVVEPAVSERDAESSKPEAERATDMPHPRKIEASKFPELLPGVRWYGKDKVEGETEFRHPSKPNGTQVSPAGEDHGQASDEMDTEGFASAIAEAMGGRHREPQHRQAPESDSNHAMQALAHMGDVVTRAAKANKITANTERKAQGITNALQLLVGAQQRVNAAIQKGDETIKPADVLGEGFSDKLRKALQDAGAFDEHHDHLASNFLEEAETMDEHRGRQRALTEGKSHLASVQLSHELKNKVGQLTSSETPRP